MKRTYIKQKGDTVFFKNNRTQNSWQILYNFAASAGDSWQTTVVQSNNTVITFIYTVDSVSFVTINGFNLKRLTLNPGNSIGTHVTERFGSDAFLFNYHNSGLGGCDGPGLMEFLCYQDSAFGIKQFGAKACDYSASNSVGITNEQIKNRQIKIYPNPVKDFLNVETNSEEETEFDNYRISFIDIYGKEVKRVKIEQKNKIDLSNLDSGIYLLLISKNNKPLYKTKLIKE